MMKIFAYIILATLFIGGGSGCAVSRQRESSAFAPEGTLADQTSFDGYTVKAYRSANGEASFEIWCGTKRAYRQQGWFFYIGGRPGNVDKAMRTPAPGSDITGNGRPNVVVYEWTGGAHCCYIAHLFELGGSVIKVAEIDGRHSPPEFIDLDGDSLPEVTLYDWTFAYWPESFVGSPAPRVVLRWVNGRYVPDAKLMEIPTPSARELSRKAEAIRDDDAWKDVFHSGKYFRRFIPQELFQTALDLIYGGHEETGRKFIGMVWPAKYPLDKELLAEFDALLSESPYWIEIRRQRD